MTLGLQPDQSNGTRTLVFQRTREENVCSRQNGQVVRAITDVLSVEGGALNIAVHRVCESNRDVSAAASAGRRPEISADHGPKSPLQILLMLQFFMLSLARIVTFPTLQHPKWNFRSKLPPEFRHLDPCN